MNTQKTDAPESLSPRFDEALLHASLVQEMMLEDGWSEIDQELLAQSAKIMGVLTRHADAALRVIKKMRGA